MIFIVVAECARCGQPLKVYPGIEDGPGATGDLYLQVTRSGITNAQVRCKNIMSCDEYLAGHGRT